MEIKSIDRLLVIREYSKSVSSTDSGCMMQDTR